MKATLNLLWASRSITRSVPALGRCLAAGLIAALMPLNAAEESLACPFSGLPDPLVNSAGKPVATAQQWRSQRAPELRALFAERMYGHMPPKPPALRWQTERLDTNYFGGKATKKEVAIQLGGEGAPVLHLLLAVPNPRRKPAPVFLGLNFAGNHATLDDPTVPLPTAWMRDGGKGVANNRATEAGRGQDAGSWPLEPSIARGYAVATFYNGDVEPDRPEAPDGIRAYYRRQGGDSYDWGTIAAWAWGLHRAVDYLVQDRDLDPRRVAVMGHSRNGKAALVAAAFDERIALVIPHQAGCGGTAPSRGRIGESVQQINDRFPHWFNAEFKRYSAQPERLPFDQHELIALCAPRPVLLSNAQEDTWANPDGQFLMLRAAEPVYRLLKAGGLEATQRPEVDRLVDSRLGYFIRPGKHSTTAVDWQVFLDFADKHLGKP